MPLSPRERVLTALNHQTPDRTPIFIGTSNTTGLKMAVYRQLKAKLHLPEGSEAYLYDWPELGTAAPEEAVLQRLRSDVRSITDRFPQTIYTQAAARPPHADFIDDWGTGSREVEAGLWYPDIHPLAQAESLEELERYPWPDPADPTRYAGVRAKAQRLAAEGRYALVGAPWLLFPLERAFALQGMDHFLVNLSLNPDFAEALIRKTTQLCQQLMAHFLAECGPCLDIIQIGDDLGTQESLLMSPHMYRRQIKPLHAAFIASIKARTSARVFFHTDGDVFPLLDDLVEIGVDILNPIQASAGKMANLAELKRRYGTALTFCGGIDTHRLLPYGSPQDVRTEVQRVQRLLGGNGGYLLASVHTIMPEVPVENILAMVDAVAADG